MKKKLMPVLALLFLLICVCGCSAKEHTVNFNTDGGSFIEAAAVKDGQKLTRPQDPVKDGCVFREWQLDGKAYDFDQPVTSGFTLLAVYDASNTATVIIGDQSYTVSFKDGEIPNVQTPKAPEGKIFKGWMIDGKMGQLSDIKNGSKVEAVFEDEFTRIACTGIKTQYNNYWTIEGTKAWNLEVKFEPADTTDVPVYSSDDESIVTVDQQGNVTAKNIGTTKIHIKCGDQEKVIGFETRAKKTDATAVVLDAKTLTIFNGGSDYIKAGVEPEKTTDKTLTYESMDKSIATVNSEGKVKGKFPGVTTVRVTAASGVYADCKVIVEGEDVIFSMKNNVSVKAGSGQKIPYKATYVVCYEGNVTESDVTTECDFHTAYTSALDIDGYGNVYAKGAVYETVDIEVYFTWSDGSSLMCTSPTYIVHVEK